jgi:hypothetical protein
MLRVPHRRIAGRAGYRLRLTSHAAAWRGEVNAAGAHGPARAARTTRPSPRAEQRASSRPNRPGGEAPTSATAAGRRCAPHRRGGSTRAGPSGQERAAARPAVDSPARQRCRRADRQAARRCRGHRRTPTARRLHRSRPRPWVAKPGASSSPKASRSRCRAPSRAASARVRVVLPLPAQPITTIRSGIGSVGAGQAAISARYGAGGGVARTPLVGQGCWGARRGNR